MMDAEVLGTLAEDIERRGVTALDAGLPALTRDGRASGASGVVLDVLQDAREPDVARVRAFVCVSRAIGRSRRAAARSAAGAEVGARRALFAHHRG